VDLMTITVHYISVQAKNIHFDKGKTFKKDDDDVNFVLDQHASLILYSARAH
jgi:hypothetical protein